MKKALLIIDVQNDYFKHGKMELHLPEEALMKINKLEDYFIEKSNQLSMFNILKNKVVLIFSNEEQKVCFYMRN